MAILVTPTDPYSTHDLRLTKGSVDIGLRLCDQRGKPTVLGMQEQPSARTAMRVAQGAGGYGDFELPYTPLVQGDFSGGMGAREFEADTTRYYDGNQIDTSRGLLMPAGKKQATSGYKTVTQIGTANAEHDPFFAEGYAVTETNFTLGGSTFIRKISVELKIGDGSFCETWPMPLRCRISITSDSGGDPGTTLITATVIAWVQLDVWQTVDFYVSSTLGAGNYHLVQEYHGANELVVDASARDLKLRRDTSETGITIKDYVIDTGWVTQYSNQALVWQWAGAGPGVVYFFELGGLAHAVNRGDDGAAPTVWRNGYIAKVSATSTDQNKVNTALTLTGDSLIGKTIKIVAGPGVNEQQPWRIISGNSDGANSIISVSSPWNTAHTTDTVFVILGMDTWTACSIATFAPTKPITSLAVIDEKVYLCQGSDADVGTAANVCSVTMSVAAAGPTYTGADQGAKRDLVCAFLDTDGKKKVLTAVCGTRLVYKNLVSELISASTAMNNTTACGTTGTRMTGLIVYDEPPRPYLFFEDEVGSINNNVYAPIRLTEMPAVRSETNGRAAATSDKYLFFSMGEGIERYYAGILDDVGPDRGEGLPSGRRGQPVHLAAYPGGILYAAIDAGDSGYSSILKYNGDGWTEIYRAALGVRIRRLFIQNIAGVPYQRLWFSEEEDISYLPIAKNPLQATGFTYAASCSLITAWMFTAYKDIKKFWNSLKLFAVNASATAYVTVEYQADDEATWHALADAFNSSPSEEHTLTATYAATGIKLRFRLTLTTPSPYTTPVYVERMVTEAVTRIPPKRSWPVTVLLASYGPDANGDLEGLSAQAQHATLRNLANSNTQADPVLMRSRNPNADNLYVFVEPQSVRPLMMVTDPAAPDVTNLVCTFTLVEA